MHSSLKLQTNLVIIIACAIAAVAVSVLTRPFPTTSSDCKHHLWFNSWVHAEPKHCCRTDAFRSAETAMAVRQALTSTTSGKRAIQIQWILLPLLLASALWIGNPFGAVAGFAIFMCVRDACGDQGCNGPRSDGPALLIKQRLEISI